MEKLISIIEKQQKGHENEPLFCVGEQLKDIAEREPHVIDILKRDLEIPEMSLAKAAAKIKSYADEKSGKKGAFAVSPKIAEGILRKFYGLPEPGEAPKATSPATGAYIDLDNFL